ncbi:MAG: hypothetical protein BWK76_01085 [Desulfobulbaceae bacterium A2]|nr:MAG: hypothetical protein BWK76_01085 [Desulfobulbaceae bacterium A2]
MARDLLHLCARATADPVPTEDLAASCAQIRNWDDLLRRAEEQSLAPLLHWHLKDRTELCPNHFRRAAFLLFLRHRHVNTVLLQALSEVLALLGRAGIEVLVLKGAALCRTIYPEIALRPMRDIDLLVRHEQAQQAQDMLLNNGFSPSRAPRPVDHFHLPSLHTTVDAVPVCIELHTGLFPACPPGYRHQDFDDLRQRAAVFSLPDATEALTLGNEDMLWHVFNHGLRMPLTYEPFKLVTAADIITLVEMRVATMDWPRIGREYPEVLAALPQFHHLSPWSKQVLARLPNIPRTRPAGSGTVFRGWPRRRLKELQKRNLFGLLRDSFLPPAWWCWIYYGCANRMAFYRCRLLTHPRHVFWWIRLHAALLPSAPPPVSLPSLAGRLRRWCHMTAALMRKLTQATPKTS